MEAIEVHALTKAYGSIRALDGVDLRVPGGSLFGLLGPNGAGKSTLIKALVGTLRPSGGTARVLGFDPLADRAKLRAQIGYMPQAPALYPDLSARANIAFFAAAHAIPDRAASLDEVLAFTDLAGRQHDAVGTFSGGMQRRVSLACALVHKPRVLFLDEPTAAVDPALRARFWDSFRHLAASGVTLFISTHLMDEALLCDRVAIMRQGRVLASETPRALLDRGSARLTVTCRGSDQTATIGTHPSDLAASLHRYGLSPDVGGVRVDTDSLEVVVLAMISQKDRQEAGT